MKTLNHLVFNNEEIDLNLPSMQNAETKNNKTTIINENSTNDQYPTAKAVFNMGTQSIGMLTEIAEGKCTSYVFDTEEQLDNWLTEDGVVEQLKTGDVFLIRDVKVPDYWWDVYTNTKYPLETTKVELNDYVLKEEGKTLTSNDYTNAEKNKVTIAYEYSQAQHAPDDAQKNVQSDWTETDTNSDAYINNKPNLQNIPFSLAIRVDEFPSIEERVSVISNTTVSEFTEEVIQNLHPPYITIVDYSGAGLSRGPIIFTPNYYIATKIINGQIQLDYVELKQSYYIPTDVLSSLDEPAVIEMIWRLYPEGEHFALETKDQYEVTTRYAIQINKELPQIDTHHVITIYTE